MNELIILGKGPTRDECTFDTEVWGINDCYLQDPTPKRIDRLFQVKDIAHNPEVGDVEELRLAKIKYGFKLITAEPIVYNDLHEDRLYPIKEISEHFQTKFFANSFTYLMAMAIWEHDLKKRDLSRIKLFGCDLRGAHEYLRELNCMNFWCGVAIGRDIKIGVPEYSAVLKYPNGIIYGHWDQALQAEIEGKRYHAL